MNREVNSVLEIHQMRPPLVRYFTNKAVEVLPEELPQKVEQPKVLLIRYGAIGDMVFCSPLPRLFKEQGYYVVVNTQPYGLPILMQNPYIDEFWVQERNVIQNKKLGSYWEKLGEGFDKVINLSESIEATLLKMPEREDHDKERDKEKQDVNYYDHTMTLAGFPEKTGLRGELYFTEEEEEEAKKLREKYQDNFVVLVCLSGSSLSKAWHGWHFLFVPEMPDVNGRMPSYYGLYDEIPEMVTISTGGDVDRLLDWTHSHHAIGSGAFGGPRMSIRETLILTKYADLVLGPDTGFMHAAGCFDTPKICLLGQTTKNNLTKYWINDYSIESSAPCAPCYNLIYSMNQCAIDIYHRSCACMGAITPDLVTKQIKAIYKEWKRKRFHTKQRIVTPQQYKKEVRECPQSQILSLA